jgi:hypothetical protein
MMKIGCMMISESRPHMLPIGVCSFLDQMHQDLVLIVITSKFFFDRYNDILKQLIKGRGFNYQPVPKTIALEKHSLVGPDTVENRFDCGCHMLFSVFDCDAIAMWDDDDYKAPDYLAKVSDQLESNPSWLITGYLSGTYVNARTLYGHRVLDSNPWGYWGGSLVWRRQAWEDTKWTGLNFPSSDRAFAESTHRRHWAPNIDPDDHKKMLAFCHGKNMCQHFKGGSLCEDLAPWMKDVFLDSTWREVEKVRQYFIDNDIDPYWWRER